jgi:hypothetical protein
MNGNLLSNTNIYKNTYAELVIWIKELLAMRREDQTVYDRNIRQAARIMELEFDLRKYRRIMVDNQQETTVKEYGVMESDVVSLDEVRRNRVRLKGGGEPPNGDWLSTMKWGTEFLVRPKVQKTWLLVRFMMAGIRGGMALIIPMRGDEPVQDDKDWMWADPVEFCKYWELMAVLLVPKDEISNE